MKKAICLLLAIIFAMSVSACSLLKSVTPSAEAEKSEAAESQDTVRKTDTVQKPATWMEEDPYGEDKLLEALEDIDASVEIGTSGSALKAVRPTAGLIEWGMNTGMQDLDIQEALTAFLDSLDADHAEEFRTKLKIVDSTYQTLMTEGQEDFVESAGCSDCGYPWGVNYLPTIEAIMEVAGYRNAAADTSVYDGILQTYRAAIQAQTSAEDLTAQNLNYIFALNYGMDPLNSAGYWFTDLSFDGTPELVLGLISDDFYNGKLILDLYTVKDNAVELLCRSADKNQYFLYGDNTIQNVNSAEEGKIVYSEYRMENGELVLAGEMINTYDAATATSKWTKDGVEISIEEAAEYRTQWEKLYLDLELEPFSAVATAG